jgi:hypothetical protein
VAHAEAIIEVWAPVARILKSAQASQAVDQQELTALLEESNRLLFPLEDPFCTDFALHRWLRGSREEVYSDWLAWIMEGLDNAADVFRLFDINVPADAAQWNSAAAQRESPIPKGRLDIVLRWPDRALLVVEVKVTDEDSASTDKQKRYRRWMDRQAEPYKEAVLLVIDADSGSSKGGFARRDWRTVCLKLRSMAASKSHTGAEGVAGTRRGQAVRSALMLALAGAVEQNLLDMPGRPLQLMNRGHLLNVFLVQQYLEEFHRSAQL